MTKANSGLAFLGAAKTKIDHGFSRIGPKLDFSDPAQRMLMLLAARAIAVSNAVALLVRHDLSNEAVPLVHSLLGLSVEMSWIAQKDHARRARELAAQLKGLEADWFWDTARLKKKMKELGFEPSLARELEQAGLEHLEGNVEGIPWGHSLPDTRKGLPQDRLLDLAAGAAEHVLSSLNAFWPEFFETPAKMEEK